MQKNSLKTYVYHLVTCLKILFKAMASQVFWYSHYMNKPWVFSKCLGRAKNILRDRKMHWRHKACKSDCCNIGKGMASLSSFFCAKFCQNIDMLLHKILIYWNVFLKLWMNIQYSKLNENLRFNFPIWITLVGILPQWYFIWKLTHARNQNINNR